MASPLANRIKCSNYFDKFSLLTHTDEQNLYFDKFFYDKCTCSKASIELARSVHDHPRPAPIRLSHELSIINEVT
jgi:hypothetical protein